jgi:iron complex transport system ATP-binding protein
MTLSVHSLSLTLGKRAVLSNLSLTFAPGSVTVILGPNGAGKTSLIRALAGLLPGDVTLEGTPLAALDPAERARRIGYLPQDGAPAWNVTARELVALGRLPHRSRFAAPSPADDAAVEAALAATDTAYLAERTVDAMSGGERARVKFARVLAGSPQWILADEPLANLDPAHQLDLLALLRAEADRGAGVVAVLHDLNQAARIADQLVVLCDGRLAASGAPQTVLTPALLAEVFGIEAEIVPGADGKPIIAPRRRVVQDQLSAASD